jgi:hypothetical protein
MTATVLAYPPFVYPGDWRQADRIGGAMEATALAGEMAVDNVSRDHDAKHTRRAHPWCLRCEVMSALPDPHRLARARQQLGDPDDYADVLDDVTQLVNTRTPAPVDLDRLAADHGLDTDTIRDAVEYLYALDEAHAENVARAEADRTTPGGYAAAPGVVCTSRAARYLALHNRRIPTDTYDPSTDNGTTVDGYGAEVASEALKLRIREDARALHEQQKALRNPADPFDAGLLSEILARPPEPAHRVEGLIPANAATLVVAQRKTGKTTFNLNLARAFLTGEDFLGRFAVEPIAGRVSILNFEVAGAQLGRWAADVGIDPDRLHLVNLRGRRNPLAHPADRAALAELLRSLQVETLIVDPFGRAYTGQSQNDAGEVGAWLTDLDTFARTEVGVTDLILNAHAGWDGERTRGASALEDWADSIITLTRGKEDDDGRYMRAIGRDVDVDEDGLTYDVSTRSLTMAGTGSRRTRASVERSEFLISAVHGVITASPGFNGSQVGDTLRRQKVAFRKGDENKALAAAVNDGLLRMEPGPRGAKLYYPNDIPRRPPTSPAGVLTTSPGPLLYGGPGEGGRTTLDLPRTIDTQKAAS